MKAMNIRKQYSPLFFHPEKDLHKGTSEAPVLPESERKRRSKGISMGRRQA